MNQIYPEIFLLVATSIVALVGLQTSAGGQRGAFWIAQLSLLVFAGLHLSLLDAGDAVYVMQRMVVSDPLGHLLAIAATLAVMITLGYARPYLASRDLLKGEFLSLALFSLLGVSVMVSANNFLVVYVGLELMTLSLYALTALRRDDVLHPRRAGQRLPAVRPVDDVRRHRHARHPAGVRRAAQGHDQSARAG